MDDVSSCLAGQFINGSRLACARLTVHQNADTSAHALAFQTFLNDWELVLGENVAEHLHLFFFLFVIEESLGRDVLIRLDSVHLRHMLV